MLIVTMGEGLTCSPSVGAVVRPAPVLAKTNVLLTAAADGELAAKFSLRTALLTEGAIAAALAAATPNVEASAPLQSYFEGLVQEH